MVPSQSSHPEPFNPEILSGSQNPEEPDTSSSESHGAPVPIHLQDPEQPDPVPEDSIPSLFPIHQNAPEGHEQEQETNLPKPNLRTLIKQNLRHPNQPRPALPREVLQAHQARINSFANAINHRSKICSAGSAFCESTLRYVRQIGYILQLIESHMERNGGEASEDLDLREMREKVEYVLESLREARGKVVRGLERGSS